MSRRAEERRQAALLARRRHETKEAVAQVQRALGGVGRTDLGRVRAGAAWVLPVAAGAVGFAVAWWLRRLGKG